MMSGLNNEVIEGMKLFAQEILEVAETPPPKPNPSLTPIPQLLEKKKLGCINHFTDY